MTQPQSQQSEQAPQQSDPNPTSANLAEYERLATDQDKTTTKKSGTTKSTKSANDER